MGGVATNAPIPPPNIRLVSKTGRSGDSGRNALGKLEYAPSIRTLRKTKMRPFLLPCVVATLLLAACAKKTEPPAAAPAPAKPAYGSFGVDLAQMDTSVKPGDDFYNYVNGKWLATATIPADRPYSGMIVTVYDQTEANLHAIVDELAASKPAAGSVDQKVADMYASWMDEAGVEARGIGAAQAIPRADRRRQGQSGSVKLIGTIDYQAPFNVFVEADPADPTRYVVWITQSGLGMPNRDYYFNKGAKFDGYRAAYMAYVTRLFELLGDKPRSRRRGEKR